MVPRFRSFSRLAVALLALMVLFTAGAAYAATPVPALPFVNNFATARFKVLSTAAIADIKAVSYGEGAAVMPDRASMWLTMDGADEFTSMVQIGKTIYQRVGNGEWETSEVNTLSDMQFQPLSAQFNQLQQFATAIYDMGPATVGSTPTEQYQVWIDGTRALAMAGADVEALPSDMQDVLARTHYKYDFWIGTQDSFVYQQNVEILMPEYSIEDLTIPAIQIDVLMTFSDINDPNLSVNAPI
jgi:hypothetical protein